jgi:phosphoglycolate phosphatase
MDQDGEVPDIAHIKRGERKPNPKIVSRICEEMGVPPSQTLYVGDSIISDIGMAKEAGAWTAWAEYGTHYDPVSWDKLVRITHWTAEDVRRVKQARERYGHSLPDAVLQTGFSDIVGYFAFSDQATMNRASHGQEELHHGPRDPSPVPLPEPECGDFGGA